MGPTHLVSLLQGWRWREVGTEGGEWVWKGRNCLVMYGSNSAL